jgi:hypothetical protein
VSGEWFLVPKLLLGNARLAKLCFAGTAALGKQSFRLVGSQAELGNQRESGGSDHSPLTYTGSIVTLSPLLANCSTYSSARSL